MVDDGRFKPAPLGPIQSSADAQKPQLLDPASIAPPAERKFTVAFYIGPKASVLLFTCANEMSAAMAALFVAQRSWPTVHTFGVWEGEGQEATRLVCYVPLSGIIGKVAPILNAASQTGPVIPALPAVPTGKGFDELMRESKKQGGQA